jgi:hypothetical protein
MDPDIKSLFHILIESQMRTDKTVGDLAVIMTKYVDAADERAKRMEDAHTRMEDAHTRLNESIDRYTVAADARMRRIEENLDGLIRAITSEHGNGRKN